MLDIVKGQLHFGCWHQQNHSIIKKIDAMFALAPIAYVANVKSPLFRALLPFDSLITVSIIIK